MDLTAFTLEGKARKDVREIQPVGKWNPCRALRHRFPTSARSSEPCLTNGCGFWTRERASPTFFDPDYLRSTTVLAAVDGEPVLAFVNLVPSYKKGETTIDLMRRRTDAPNGIMDYLFGKLFIELKKDGYLRFNMGMAPMAGFQKGETFSVGEKVTHQLLQKLNFAFSFSGLRAYKAKFANFWEPRYIVYRNITDLPFVALAVGKMSVRTTRTSFVFVSLPVSFGVAQAATTTAESAWAEASAASISIPRGPLRGPFC